MNERVVVGDLDVQARKKAIFDHVSPRRRKYIEKVGYDKWDPFEEPKDPLDIRRDKTRRTTQQLVRDFLQTCDRDNYSNAYGRGVLEIALGVINEDDRYVGMFEFANWYQAQLQHWEDEKSSMAGGENKHEQ